MSVTEDLLARAEEVAGDETSRRILAAALERFSVFGIRRTTMDDVAAAAGIGRATLYRRFAGRDEIVRATIVQEMARFIATVDAAVAEVADPGERLVEGFVTILKAARSHPLLSRLLETEPEVMLPFLTENAPLMVLCRDYLTEQLRAAQASGAIAPQLEADVMAEVLVRLSQSLLVTPHGVIDADDEQQLRRLGRDYVIPLLFRSPPAPRR